MIQNITFSAEYAISIAIVVIVISSLMKLSPQLNTFVAVIIGLIVGYFFLLFMNYVFPQVNSTANSWYQFFTYSITNKFDDMGYMQVWPPIMAVLIIFVILLYNRNMGSK